MAIALLTLSGNIHDTAGGVPVDARRCIVSIVPCDANGVIKRVVDPASNEERYGNARAVVNPTTGDYQFTDLWPTNAATNPTGYYYEVFVEYVLARGSNRERHNGRPVWRSGPFQLTASADMADLDLDTPAVSATWRSAFRDEMEAIRDDVVDISEISTSDDVVEALLKGTAGAGPKTRAALGTVAVDLSGGNVTLTAVGAKAYELNDATASRTVTVPNVNWAASFTNSTDFEQVVIRTGSTVGARIPAGATAELRG